MEKCLPLEPESILSAAKVLLVDDDPDFCARLARTFQGAGLDCQVAQDARKALELIRSRDVDLVLTDVVMPELDGFELCRLLKNDDRTATIPVVIVSGYLVSEVAAELGRELGAAAVLPKSLGVEAIMEKAVAATRHWSGSEPWPERAGVVAARSDARWALRRQPGSLGALLQTLGQLVRSLALCQPWEELVAQVSASLRRSLDCDAGIIFLTQTGIPNLPALAQPIGWGIPDGLDSSLARLQLGPAAVPREPIFLSCLREADELLDAQTQRLAREAGTVSLAYLPMRVHDEVIGVLMVGWRKEHGFTLTETDFLTSVAALLAVGLYNTRLQADCCQSQERFQVLFDNAPDFGCLIDHQGTILMANKKVADLLTLRPGQVVGRNWIDLLDAPERAAARAAMEELFATQQPLCNFETCLRAADGSARRVSINAALLSEADSSPAPACFFLRDLSQRLALEEALLQAQKMKVLGQLAGGVAHEFNNLLAGLSGYIELARLRLHKGESVGAYLEKMLQLGERAGRLTRQLLNFSRPAPPEQRVVDLNTLVREEVEGWHALLGKLVKVRTELSSVALPVAGDRGQLAQVLLNLCLNARDAMPEGGEIAVSSERVVLEKQQRPRQGLRRPGCYALLRVRDTGMGIEEKALSQIFDPFFTTKPGGQGTGLGLTVVNWVVARHQGWVEVDSQPSQGTCFHVYLPLTNSLAQSPAPTSTPIPSAGGPEVILIIDDEPPVLEVVSSLLADFGYTVLTAADESEAEEILRNTVDAIALLLFDAQLARRDDFAFFRQLKQRHPDLCGVLMTGSCEEEIAAAGRRAGFGRCLFKPFQGEELIRVVREVLDERDRGRPN